MNIEFVVAPFFNEIPSYSWTAWNWCLFIAAWKDICCLHFEFIIRSVHHHIVFAKF